MSRLHRQHRCENGIIVGDLFLGQNIHTTSSQNGGFEKVPEFPCRDLGLELTKLLSDPNDPK